MKIDKHEARKIIRFNNLLWRCTFYDELITWPSYELCFVLNTRVYFMNCSMNFDMESIEEVKEELPEIEKYFKTRRKATAIYLTDFDSPTDIEPYIKTIGFKEIEDEKAIFWGASINEIKTPGSIVEGLEIKECRTRDDLAHYLIAAKSGYDDFDYTPYAASFSKLFNTNIDGITQLHFIGYMDGKIAACGTMGIYTDCAIWINAAVIPEFRRKGINTAMMYHAVTQAAQLGAKKFYYCTEVGNMGSIKSGTKIGFSQVLEQRMYSKK